MRHPWQKRLFLATIVCVLTFAGAYKAINFTKENSVATFVITETGKYTSLDPLDGDSSQNLPVARMLYATPVEINSDNTLTSSLLDEYSYDSSTKTIHWMVRKNIVYSDGSLITSEDIAFAVARMAYTRPNFPLVKLIKGLSSWLHSQNPLKSFPEGIKIKGNKITIELTEDYPHPLFRFCLELFGVIPKSCVDLETNKISCEKIPGSGYYEIAKNLDSEIVFNKRKGFDLIQGYPYPGTIKFVYRSIKDAFGLTNQYDDKTVILSNESKFTRDELKNIQNDFHIGFTPAAWFTILQINPTIQPFDKAECRLAFAEAFRKTYQRLSGDVSGESSVFTKIVAGYMSHEELKRTVAANSKSISESECHTKLRTAQALSWGYDSATASPLFVDAIKETAKELGVKLSEPIQIKDRKDETDQFVSGNLAFMYGRTGFWALDPSGDIQMLFTPNLHKGLQYFWNDSELQTLLGSAVQNGQVDLEVFKKINQYLFENGKFNVYSHIRRFYASPNKQLVQNLPIGITSPAPWHLFGERQ